MAASKRIGSFTSCVLLVVAVSSCSAVPRRASTPPPAWHPHRDRPSTLLLVFEGRSSFGVRLEWTDQGSALRVVEAAFRPFPPFQPIVVESELVLRDLVADFPLGHWPCHEDSRANGYWLTSENGELMRVADRLDVDSPECRRVVRRARTIAKLAGLTCKSDGTCDISAPRQED